MGQIIRIADAMLLRYEGGPRLFELGRIEVKKKADGIGVGRNYCKGPCRMQDRTRNCSGKKETLAIIKHFYCSCGSDNVYECRFSWEKTAMRHEASPHSYSRNALAAVPLLFLFFARSAGCQQVDAPSVQRDTTHIDYSKSHSFPHIFAPYAFPSVPEPRLADSPRLQDLIVDGKLTLSLEDAIALALENNGEIAVARFELPIAQTDLLRAKGGGATRGVGSTYQSTTLFSGSLGGGVGSGAASLEEASTASAQRAAAIRA